jgi:ribose transport system substrate-binding protein
MNSVFLKLSKCKLKVINIMKNRIALLFCLVLMNPELFLAQAVNSDQRRKITIVMIGKSNTNPVFLATYSGACIAAKELGAKYKADIIIDWQTPKVEDAREQANAIERSSHTGIDGIAIACTDANYLTPVIDKAIDKGMPVLCFDSDAPKSKRFVYYGADDVEFGKILLQELAKELKGKGAIAILAGNKNALNQQRRLQGVKDALKTYPNISLPADNVYHNLEITERAVETFTRAQNNNPNIKGWVFIGSWALQQKNSFKWNPGDVKVVAGNAIPSELEYVKSGYVQALVGVNCFQMGYKSVELLLEKILRNYSPTEKQIFAPLTAVSKENVEEWSLNWKKWLLKEAVSR